MKTIFLLKGFHEFHEESLKYNLKSAVATNSTLRALDIVNKTIKLDQFFGEHLYSMEHVDKKAKPNPDLFLYAADKLKIDPKECLVIEDSVAGVHAAKAAGMFCVQILSHPTIKIESDADLIVNEYQNIDLHKILHTK